MILDWTLHGKERCEEHYWDSWGHLNIDCTLDNSSLMYQVRSVFWLWGNNLLFLRYMLKNLGVTLHNIANLFSKGLRKK